MNLPRFTGTKASVLLLCLSVLAAAREEPDVLPGKRWSLETPAAVSEVTTKINPAWREIDCARCHEAIALEWAESRHGQAWNEEVYQQELAKIKKRSKCTSCHAPQPLLVNGIDERVVVREENPHWGVDCNSCHLGADGSIQGPFGAATDAHASTKNALFSTKGSNELCLSCHSRSVGPVIGIGRDFDDAELADRDYACVSCHMAPVTRRIASGDELPERIGRSHRLQTPRDPSFLRQAFEWSAVATEEGARFTLSNRAGHRIPGLNDRILTFDLELLDEQGKKLASDFVEISRSEAIGVAERVELELLGLGAHALRVKGTHEAASLSAAVVFLEETLPLVP